MEKIPTQPDVQIIAISNVYCRMMHFKNKGDFEIGHYHTYDHGTLVSSGKILAEILEDESDNVKASKIFEAPNLIFVAKNFRHRLTALEDNTIVGCIHAMRDIEGEILSPEFLIEQKSFADKWEDSDDIKDHYHLYTELKRGVKTKRFSLTKEEFDFFNQFKN